MTNKEIILDVIFECKEVICIVLFVIGVVIWIKYEQKHRIVEPQQITTNE